MQCMIRTASIETLKFILNSVFRRNSQVRRCNSKLLVSFTGIIFNEFLKIVKLKPRKIYSLLVHNQVNDVTLTYTSYLATYYVF